MRFTWSAAKAAANERKHGVAFEEAATVFGDPLARIHGDPIHSGASETREIIVGHSSRGWLLLVSFTERRQEIRLISARKATRNERRDYQEASK